MLLKMSSVASSSSPVVISHATRPLTSTTSSLLVNPSLLRHRFLRLSSSLCCISVELRISFLSTFASSASAAFSANRFSRSAMLLPWYCGSVCSFLRSVSTLVCSFRKAGSAMFMSCSGCSIWGLPLNRLSTSATVLPTSSRAFCGRRSFGMMTRTELMPFSTARSTGTTCISQGWSSRAGLGRWLPGGPEAAGAQRSRTSTTYECESPSPWTPAFFWKLTMTPQPQSSSPSRTFAMRPGCRKGRACLGLLVHARMSDSRSESCFFTSYSSSTALSSSMTMATRVSSSAFSFFSRAGRLRRFWNWEKERLMT
mmetsp:Transcript_13024/g.22509  ORF Transcript_13024/g.22509 Transcript_13024/m.22509 type:complete len:312 (-) Transcript_13024:120-1055(-)